MESIEGLEPKRQTLLKKSPGKDATAQDKGGKVEGDDPELALYRLYYNADANQNGEIDEGEAKAFYKIYMAGFNARVGAIKY